MELTAKMVCVPLRVCGIIRPLPMSMFLCAQQCVMKLLPQCIQQGSCCVHLRTCVTARFKLALVNLSSQWSSVVHMCMDPLCLL